MKRSALRLSTLIFTAIAACSVAFSPIARAQNPTFTTVDYPGAATTTSLTGINDLDQFVGIYDDAQGNTHSYQGKIGVSSFIPIDFPGAVQTYVFRINNQGEIVGTYFDKNGYQHGFLRLPPKVGQPFVYASFDVPGAVKNPQFDYELGTGLGTSAFGLNNLGDLVGQYADINGVGHGYLLTSHTKFSSYTEPDANTAPGFYGGSALSDINDFGDMVGGYASNNPMTFGMPSGFLLHNGQLTELSLPNSLGMQVFGVNDSLQVTGFYYDFFAIGHGFIYQNDQYQIIDVPGAVFVSTVGTLNNHGHFVGEFVDGTGFTHGYIGVLP